MNKYLRVTMPDGSKWDVPAQIIAESCAKHYDSTVRENPMGDEALIDWAENNMNWAEVSERAVRLELPRVKPDYQDGWVNGEKEVVEK